LQYFSPVYLENNTQKPEIRPAKVTAKAIIIYKLLAAEIPVSSVKVNEPLERKLTL